jgi:hypothetical protein
MKTYYRHIPSKRICTIFKFLGQEHLQFQDNGQIQPLSVNGLYSFDTIEGIKEYEN